MWAIRGIISRITSLIVSRLTSQRPGRKPTKNRGKTVVLLRPLPLRPLPQASPLREKIPNTYKLNCKYTCKLTCIKTCKPPTLPLPHIFPKKFPNTYKYTYKSAYNKLTLNLQFGLQALSPFAPYRLSRIALDAKCAKEERGYYEERKRNYCKLDYKYKCKYTYK